MACEPIGSNLVVVFKIARLQNSQKEILSFADFNKLLFIFKVWKENCNAESTYPFQT